MSRRIKFQECSERPDIHSWLSHGWFRCQHLLYMRWYSKIGRMLGITAGATILSVGHVSPRYLGWSEGVTILPLIAWLKIPYYALMIVWVSRSCGDRRRRYYPTGRSRKPQVFGVIGRSYHPSADRVTQDPHISIVLFLWPCLYYAFMITMFVLCIDRG